MMMINQPNTNQFYVYSLHRPGEEPPFYIGKGCGKRAINSTYLSGKGNPYKFNIIKKIINEGKTVETKILKNNLTEEQAYILEERLISYFGKKDNGGILSNMSNGGPSGLAGVPLSEEHKLKISKSNNGRVVSKETKEKISKANKGKVRSKETKEKFRQNNIGKTHSEETKLKMSNSHMGTKNHFYGKLHSEETKNKMKNAPRNKEVSIDGVIYRSTSEASKSLNYSNGKVYRRLKSNNFPTYFFTKENKNGN